MQLPGLHLENFGKRYGGGDVQCTCTLYLIFRGGVILSSETLFPHAHMHLRALSLSLSLSLSCVRACICACVHACVCVCVGMLHVVICMFMYNYIAGVIEPSVRFPHPHIW